MRIPKNIENYVGADDSLAKRSTSPLLRPIQHRFQIEIDGRDTPARLAIKRVSDVIRPIHRVPFANKDDGKNKLLPLVEGVQNLIASDAYCACSLHAAFHFDMTRLRQLAVNGWRVGCQIPTALISGNIDDPTPTRLFSTSNCMHRSSLDSLPRSSIGCERGCNRIDRRVASPSAE